ncbi:hypothetical protein [Streptomyces sp. NPDC050504]|uniref:hypothetical protein n=1 Tax=Streptomyces sp. NPDC050504 TaxID=3365618 RepID=UPI00378849F7
MTIRSAWHQPTGQTREDTRLAVSLGMASTGPLTTLAGCVHGGLQLTGSAAVSMQARLSPGRVWVAGTSAAAQGSYPVTVDADTLLTFRDGHATLPRVDALVVRVHDPDYDGTGTPASVLELIPGEPAAAPVPPGVPKNAELLYHVRVPAGASAATGITWAQAVTDRRRYTAALGGIIPAGGGPGAATSGYHVGQYRDANGRLERWDGSRWAKYVPDAYLLLSGDRGYTKKEEPEYEELLRDETPDGAGRCSAPFVGPPSGYVHISVGALVIVEHAFGGYVSCVVRQGSTVVSAASADRAAVFSGVAGRASVYTNFALKVTPGAEYVATAAYASGRLNSQVDFDNRFVRVDPVV